MRSYFAYGLGIHSELELPELTEKSAEPDIQIRLAQLGFDSSGFEMESGVFYAEALDARVRFDGIGAFLIRNGSEVLIEQVANAAPQELRLILLGSVFATLLHQRGLLVLHASAVAREDRAIAFLAEAGAGKSTAAAAMLTHGYRLLTDDILALKPESKEPIAVYPAFPFLKVSPEVASALGQNIDSAPRVSARLDKRVWGIKDAETRLTPLHCIYVLERSERSGIEAIAPQQAFVELVRHTFVALLLNATQGTQRHFQQCAVLASRVPVRRLPIPSSLTALASMADMVDADLSRGTRGV